MQSTNLFMPVADAVSFNISFKKELNNSGNKEQAFYRVEDDWDGGIQLNYAQYCLDWIWGWCIDTATPIYLQRFNINSVFMPSDESVSVTGQTQWCGRQDGLFLQLPDMNSDPWEHVGPLPIRHPDPQPVAACRSVGADGQHAWALVQTEVSEEKKAEELLSRRGRLQRKMKEKINKKIQAVSFVSELLFRGEKNPDRWQTDK